MKVEGKKDDTETKVAGLKEACAAGAGYFWGRSHSFHSDPRCRFVWDLHS